MIHRRTFLRGLVGLIAAPAIVTIGNIMPVKALGPEAVYSLRRYKRYTGPALRLYGESNAGVAAAYDFGFTPDGNLDWEAIKRLVGDRPRLARWYDQSGNGHDMVGDGSEAVLDSSHQDGTRQMIFQDGKLIF